MRELDPGTVFAGHRIEALAGRGGMGVVYRATHLALDRTVALKVIAPALVEDASTRQRFLRESKLAASIDHPNVIPVYYTGEEDGIAYIAMRYVQGQDLRTLVREEGALEPVHAARIVAQIAAALDAAHAAGLVHRDVKPANALLAGEHVYLSDFGLSKHALSVGGETRSGHWVGTLDYVAPEQIRGERLDARADVYALGCVLYFALTGCAPFERDGDEARLWAHLTELPPAASDRAPAVPPELDAVIARALAKNPDDRYPSAGDLGRAAIAAAGREEVRERRARGRRRRRGAGRDADGERDAAARAPVGGADCGRQRRPNRRRAAIAAGVAGVAIAAAALILLIGGDDPPPGSGLDPTPTPTSLKLDVVATVGRRPNSIAVGNGTVFVTNYRNKRVALLDEQTGKLRSKGPTVGVGGRDVATGLGGAWVAVAREKALFKLDPTTGRRLGRIDLPSSPQGVTVGKDAVWVGLSTLEPDVPDTLVRIDPGTQRIAGTYPMAEGIRSLVATPRGIWIVHRHNPAVSRFDPEAMKITRRVAVGQSDLGAAAYGAGAVWVTSPQEDTVARIDDKTGAEGVERRRPHADRYRRPRQADLGDELHRPHDHADRPEDRAARSASPSPRR